MVSLASSPEASKYEEMWQATETKKRCNAAESTAAKAENLVKGIEVLESPEGPKGVTGPQEAKRDAGHRGLKAIL